MSETDIQQITENKTNIEGLKDDIGTVFKLINRLSDKVDKALETAMKRPGWAVCLGFSVLTGACMALLVALLNHLNHGPGG